MGDSENDKIFNKELENIINQFENVLKQSAREYDYPPPFWYDIVIDRAKYMKEEAEAYNKSIDEVQSEWIFMHADEYKNKYSSQSIENVIESMSLRIERFGFIYDLLLIFEEKLNSLASNNDMSIQISNNGEIFLDHPFLSRKAVTSSVQDNFTSTLGSCIFNISSAFASLYGAIKYSLSIGMTNNDIKKLYNKYIYDESVINGTNPFDKFGISKKEAHHIINNEIENFNEKYGVEMETFKEDSLSNHYTKISKRKSSMLSKLSIENRYAVFTILCHIANSDGMTNDENIILQDILLELEINVNEYNNSNMDGAQACDLLKNLNQDEKDEFSRYIVLIIGADAEFSSQEMIFVNDAIREIGLGDDILVKLTEKYW